MGQSSSAVENGGAFPHTRWSNGSSLIDLSCLFKFHRDLNVPLSNASAHADFPLAGKCLLSATALDSIIVNQEHMVFLIGLPLFCPPLPLYPHSPSRFLSPSLQIRAAEVYCHFIQAGAAMGGPGPGWLHCEWGIMSWRRELVQPNFSDRAFQHIIERNSCTTN